MPSDESDEKPANAKEPSAASLKDAENALAVLELIASEQDLHGLHYTVIQETAVERGLYTSPVSAGYVLTWLGKADWVAISRPGFRKVTDAGRALLADDLDRAELVRRVRAEFDRIDGEIQGGEHQSTRRSPDAPEFVCSSCGFIKPEVQRTAAGVCRDCE